MTTTLRGCFSFVHVYAKYVCHSKRIKNKKNHNFNNFSLKAPNAENQPRTICIKKGFGCQM